LAPKKRKHFSRNQYPGEIGTIYGYPGLANQHLFKFSNSVANTLREINFYEQYKLTKTVNLRN